MLPRPAFASALPSGVVRVRPATAVATVAGWFSENASRGPTRRTRASFGTPPAAAGDVAGESAAAPGAAAAAAGSVPAAAGPVAGAPGAGVTVTVPCMPACHTHTY